MQYDMEGLLREHGEIETLVSTLARLVQPGPLDLGRIGHVHLRLAAALEEHLSKDDCLYDAQCRRVPDHIARARIKPFAKVFAQLRRDLHSYFAAWPPEAIVRDAQRFCRATVKIITRLRSCIAYENALLLPRALQNSRIGFRAA